MEDEGQFLRSLNNEVDLSDYYQRQEFIVQTARQIIKDFAEFGIDIQFSGDTSGAYRELFEQLEYHVRGILQTKQEMFFHMLYRIDVSATSIKKAAALHPDMPLESTISDVIIQRELKKVLFRYFYKSQSSTNE
jgi:hypothetical protein